jgi:hypothetical protein
MKNQEKGKIIPFKKKKRKEIRIVKVSKILKRRAEKMKEKLTE